MIFQNDSREGLMKAVWFGVWVGLGVSLNQPTPLSNDDDGVYIMGVSGFFFSNEVPISIVY